jgi:hypothetical protein
VYIIEVEIQMQVPQNIFPNTKIALFVLSALALEAFLRSESIIVHKKPKMVTKKPAITLLHLVQMRK